VAGNALIVGAGIAGLATALRLRQSGWQVSIVERAPAPRDGGYMITFWGAGYDAAERFGLINDLVQVRTVPTELVYVDEHGRRLGAMSVARQQELQGDRALTLLRGDLEAVLLRALDDTVRIRFGTTVNDLVQADDRVTVTFDDGRRQEFDMVVGADGLHSEVRSLVFGPEEQFRNDFGYGVATYFLEGMPDGIEPGSTISMSLGARGAGIYSVRDGRSAAFFSFTSERMAADMAAGPRATLHRVFGDLGWIMPTVLSKLDDASTVYFDRVSQVSMSRWRKGRVVLVGDAAWCLSLVAGYGASLAVAGAEQLGDALDAADVDEALASWEQQIRPVVEKKQQQAREHSKLLQH
jgi:2-polyprenyl-6-methoxyphenol hydroxylase-like FAD-dependent oxidoreductase